VIDQVSYPHKTTGKVMVLYILIFKFLEGRWEDKRDVLEHYFKVCDIYTFR